METNDFLVQLTVTEYPQEKQNGQFQQIVKQIPSFVLPELLGLQTLENAQKTACKMFEKYEVHGTVLNGKNQILVF